MHAGSHKTHTKVATIPRQPTTPVEQVAAIAGRARWTFSCKVEVPLPVQKHGVLELRAVVDELLEVVAVDSCAAR